MVWYLDLSYVGMYMVPVVSLALLCFVVHMLRGLYESAFQMQLFVRRRMLPWMRNLPQLTERISAPRREPSLRDGDEDEARSRPTLKERIEAMELEPASS